MPPLVVDIWSDVVCPWCYVGKRRFEAALARFEHRDEVRIAWHSFELDPNAAPSSDAPGAERLAAKYGMSVEEARARHAQLERLAAVEGLEYHLDRTRGGNSFDAHRLHQLGAEHGLGDAVMERLMRAYFTDGETIGDPEVLERLAVEAGLDADEVRAVLDSDRYADAVRADEQVAHRLGIHGVPFFVLARRYGVSGAQPAELLLEALETAWREPEPSAAQA
jgi:predicted DsbA family dithiol-disulfide isomerase